MFWGHFVVILASFWHQLGSFWHRCDLILRSFEAIFWVILGGIFWSHLGSFLGGSSGGVLRSFCGFLVVYL